MRRRDGRPEVQVDPLGELGGRCGVSTPTDSEIGGPPGRTAKSPQRRERSTVTLRRPNGTGPVGE